MKSLWTIPAFVLNLGLLLLAFPALSQEEKTENKPEKVLIGIGAQYNLPARYFNKDLNKFDGRNSGIGFYVEPKLLKGRFLLGLKAEYTLVEEIAITDAIGYHDLISLSPTFKYLFLNRQNTPFLGFGSGLYYISYVENNLNWGIEPSAGYIFHKVQLSLNYNRVLNKIETKGGGFNNYYLALKLGVEL